MNYQERRDAVEAVFSVGQVRTLECVIEDLLDNLPEGTTQAEAIENRLDEWYTKVTYDGKPIVSWEDDPHYMSELYTHLADTCIYGLSELDFPEKGIFSKAIDVTIGALAALYIVTDLVIEFAGEAVINFVKRQLR